MPFISFLNKQIHYKTSGRGNSTVVLLHGFLENLNMWSEISSELEKAHKIISIDLPGHGKSENIAEIHTMCLMADVVEAVMTREKVIKSQVIGHSMGGYVALALAKKNPQRLDLLILLNSSLLADSDQKKLDRLRAVEVLNNNKRGFINVAIPNLFTPKNRLKLKNEIDATIIEANKTSNKGIKSALLGMRERESMLDWVKEKEINCHLISGEEDPIISVELSVIQAQKAKIPLTILSECGHMSHIEKKQILFENLKMILKTKSPI